jgi:hypothetical protein
VRATSLTHSRITRLRAFGRSLCTRSRTPAIRRLCARSSSEGSRCPATTERERGRLELGVDAQLVVDRLDVCAHGGHTRAEYLGNRGSAEACHHRQEHFFFAGGQRCPHRIQPTVCAPRARLVTPEDCAPVFLGHKATERWYVSPTGRAIGISEQSNANWLAYGAATISRSPRDPTATTVRPRRYWARHVMSLIRATKQFLSCRPEVLGESPRDARSAGALSAGSSLAGAIDAVATIVEGDRAHGPGCGIGWERKIVSSGVPPQSTRTDVSALPRG